MISAENGRRLRFMAETEGVLDSFRTRISNVSEHIHSREKNNIGRSQDDVSHGTVRNVTQRAESTKENKLVRKNHARSPVQQVLG